jgi:tetratricopeptide (TPR) repeat protein
LRLMFVLWVGFFLTNTGVSQNSERISEANSTNENISLQIGIYENAIAELQQRPFENQSLAHIMTKLGNLYSAEEDYPRAINIYMQSVFLREYNSRNNPSDKTDIAWQLVDIGNSFFNMQDYQLAEYVYKKSAQYFVLAKDQLGIITTLNNIGLCLYNTEKIKEAYEVFFTTYTLSKQIHDVTRLYTSTIYYSRMLSKMGRSNKAIKLLENVADYQLRPEDAMLNDFRIVQLGDVYLNIEDSVKALECFRELTEPLAIRKNDFYTCTALVNMAAIYAKQDQKALAIRYAQDAFFILKTLHHVSLYVDANYLLYQLYKESGDATRSLYHFEEYHNGILQLNKREVLLFANDYQRKMDRITITQDINRLRDQNARTQMEKTNQKNLSTFLIIVAVLLLVMLFTVRGFDTRLQLVADHVNAYSVLQKSFLLVIVSIYFVVYYCFFVPVDGLYIIDKMSFFNRVMPGIIAGGVSLIVVIAYNRIVAKRNPEMNWYVYSLYVSLLTFFSVYFAEIIYFLSSGLTSINFYISLALIVLASFIVPLYLFILIVENLFVKHIETISVSLSRNINEIKQKVVPEKRMITLKSEKTTSDLSFNISDLMLAEAQGNYCRFYIRQGSFIVRKLFLITMKSTDEQLAQFKSIIRCHKSYMVNIHQVESVSGKSKGYFLHLEGDVDPIPISRSFQKEVLHTLDHFQKGRS